jgi:hypothetical protein
MGSNLVEVPKACLGHILYHPVSSIRGGWYCLMMGYSLKVLRSLVADHLFVDCRLPGIVDPFPGSNLRDTSVPFGGNLVDLARNDQF